jgi:hypothetical protein
VALGVMWTKPRNPFHSEEIQQLRTKGISLFYGTMVGIQGFNRGAVENLLCVVEIDAMVPYVMYVYIQTKNIVVLPEYL